MESQVSLSVDWPVEQLWSTDVHDPYRMNPEDYDDFLICSLALPTGQSLHFVL